MWYYTTDGQSHGPLDDAGLDQLIAAGAITDQTLVWKEGLPEWKPLRDVRVATGAAPGTPAEANEACMMCGKNVGSDNLVDLLGRRVCAACKPLALQTLREGAPLASNNTAWAEGKQVVTHDQTTLPPRCYKCNHDAVGAPIKRKLYWHPAGWYLLIFVSLILYVIVAVIIRKKAAVDVFLCAEHAAKRKYFMIGGWGGAFLGLVLLTVGAAANMSWLIWVGVLLPIISIIAGLSGASLVRAARIKDGTVWLRGAGPKFLASLPPWG